MPDLKASIDSVKVDKKTVTQKIETVKITSVEMSENYTYTDSEPSK